MSELVPESLMWLSWAFRAQALLGLSLLVAFCWRDRENIGRVAAISFVSPAVCLLVYYLMITFADVPAVHPTWTTLWFQFSLGWFFLGLPTTIFLTRKSHD